MAATHAKGRLTFYGAYEKFRNELSHRLGWGAETQREYDSSYRNILVPNIPNHDKKPLDSLTREDFEKALESIRRKGYGRTADDYKDGTLEKFEYLMRVVVEIGAERYECEDCFADDNRGKRVKRQSEDSKRIIPRSMTAQQERLAAQVLLTDPMQSGQQMGLAAMLYLGTRNAEACGLDFGDIKPMRDHPEHLVAWIYKTTKNHSNDSQSSGKTSNADRVVPVPQVLAELILQRKKQLQLLLGEGVDVDALPLVCKGNDYFTRCSADDLTAAARGLFRQIGISYGQIRHAREEMERERERGDTNEDLKKDVTAYFLRRVFATSLSIVGLTESEISYVIGHHIDDPMESRNAFLAGDRLFEIAEKMVRRPIVNKPCDTNEAQLLKLGQSEIIEGSGNLKFHIPKGADGVSIMVAAKEPKDTVTLSVRTDGQKKRMDTLCCTSLMTAGQYPRQLDISHFIKEE